MKRALPMAVIGLWFITWVAVVACRPDLPPRNRESNEGGAGVVALTLEPPSAADAAPPVVRLHLNVPGPGEVDPAGFVLIEGEIGPAHLRQLEQGELSNALVERLVPTLTWIDARSALDLTDTTVVVAPTITLSRGAVYTVASGDPLFALEIAVAEDDAAPWLERIWPPAEIAATSRFAIWCGETTLAPVSLDATLEPGGTHAVLRSGVVDASPTRCLRLDAEEALDEPRIGPPAIEAGSTLVLLDPRPLQMDVEPTELTALICEDDEVSFGPGCARVLDDRILGRSPEAALLWTVLGDGLDEVFLTGPGDEFVLAPLPPLTAISLDVAAVDTAGAIRSTTFAATTKAAMPHLILNEVLANPLGPEPDQEWVEIVNDGTVTADLGGYILRDLGGEVALPEGALPPGGFALIVNEGFVEDDEIDAPPAAGTLLLRVPKLGKDGLSNAGEPLKLEDALGTVVSRFPAIPKPKPGRSVLRVTPRSPDGVASSFAVAAELPTPGTPNSSE